MSLFIRTFSIWLLLFVTGCMSTTSIRSDAPISAGEGGVVLHVTDNSADRFWKWDTLTLINADNPGKPINLQDTGGILYHSSAIFMHTLPVGRYRLESVSASRNDKVGDAREKTEREVLLMNQAATFDVDGKTIVDLGTLVISSNNSIDHIESHFFRKHLASRYAMMSSSAQLVVASPVVKPSVSAGAIKSLRALNPPTSDSKGNLYFGSRLGKVFVRSKKGTWRTIQLPTVSEIRYLSSSANKWLVVAEDELLLSDDAGNKWQTIAIPEDGGKAEFANYVGNTVHVITSRPAIGNLADFFVYQLTGGGWARVAEKRAPHAGLFQLGNTEFSLETYLWDQATSTVAIGGYDAASKEMRVKWALLRNPKRMPVSNAVHGIGISAKLLSSKSSFIVIDGDGKQSEVYSFVPPEVMVDTVFESGTNGYALMATVHSSMPDANREFTMWTQNYRLMKTRDGGATWSLVSKLKGDGFEKLLLPSNNALLLIDRKGDVSASSDGGHSWMAERRIN